MIHSRWNRAAGVVLIAAACWAAQAQQPPVDAAPPAGPPPAPPSAGAPGTPAARNGARDAASGTTITIVMPDGSTRAQIVLAVPALGNLAALQGTAGNAARTVDQTLRNDLEKSGIFRLQEADELAVLTLTGDLAHDADQYRSLGAEMLLANEIKQDGDRLVIEGRLIDLASRQPIVGKRYRGTFDLARRIAHTFADEIILYLTGKRGIALTSIAFSSDRDGEKEIYLMDYDGFDQRRITGHRSISLSPAWSPTGRRALLRLLLRRRRPGDLPRRYPERPQVAGRHQRLAQHLADLLAGRSPSRVRARSGRQHRDLHLPA